jgi:predicted AAA+ superfamily ATPase
MDKRRKILVNNYEQLADELIIKAVSLYGARVCPKLGLKDIIYSSM